MSGTIPTNTTDLKIKTDMSFSIMTTSNVKMKVEPALNMMCNSNIPQTMDSDQYIGVMNAVL